MKSICKKLIPLILIGNLITMSNVFGFASEDSGFEDQEVELNFLERLSLAERDMTFEFSEFDGNIVVSVLQPTDEVQLLDYLILEEKATPLEIYQALAPDQRAPQELILQHKNAVNHQPKDFTSAIDPSSVLSGSNSFYYSYNCSYSSDLARFNELKALEETNWLWYWY